MQDLSRLLYRLKQTRPEHVDHYARIAESLGIPLIEWVDATLAASCDLLGEEVRRDLLETYRLVRDARAKAIAAHVESGMTVESATSVVDTTDDHMPGIAWKDYLPAGALGRIIKP